MTADQMSSRLSKMLARFCASLLGAVVLFSVFPSHVARAADFFVGDASSLISAINTANANGQDDVIHLTASITLTAVNNTTKGPNGLPVILPDSGHALTIDGGGFTIERAAAAADFRFLKLETNSDLTLSDITLENGSVTGGYDGGAIYMKYATLALSHVALTGNQAGDKSGALDTAASTITISDSTFSGNSSGGGGGAIGNGTGSTMTITGSTITGNSAGGDGGGGIGDFGTLTIIDSTISGNKDVSGLTGGGGGGIGASAGLLHITGSAISDNSSNGAFGGGGIGLIGTDTTITNCTIAGNSASGDLGGGGILALSASLKLVFSTVVRNSATGGAGGGGVGIQAFPFGGAPASLFTAKSSIVADNTAGGDCASAAGGGTFASAGTSFDSDGSCAALDSTFTQHTPAELDLGGLAYNGGSTQTIALFPQSVAVDAASDCNDLTGAPVTTDQRGVLRPQDGNGDGTAACDLGAYELIPPVTAIPALSLTGLALLGLLLAGGALGFLRRS